MKKHLVSLCLISTIGLSACGGGGTGPITTILPSTVLPPFPLQAGFKSFVSKASCTNYLISGSCEGTSTEKLTGQSPATFNGVESLSVTKAVTGTFNNCTPATFSSSSTTYYDTNYIGLGGLSSTQYGIFEIPPKQFPTSVVFGTAAEYGTLALFTDSSKITRIGRNDLSYLIEMDPTAINSADSAIANLITKNYNAANQLLSIEQARYRLSADGTFTPVSRDVQFSTTKTDRLISKATNVTCSP